MIKSIKSSVGGVAFRVSMLIAFLQFLFYFIEEMAREKKVRQNDVKIFGANNLDVRTRTSGQE